MEFASQAALNAAAVKADQAFRAGEIGEAMRLYGMIARDDPNHRAAHMTIAATLCVEGRVAEGRDVMRSYFGRCPLDAPAPVDQTKPLVLKIRGFDRTEITAAPSERHGYITRLRGGHFTTAYLLLDPPWHVRTFTIAEFNLFIPGALPAHAVMVNTIAEPDVEAESLKTLQKYMETAPNVPLINRPDRVFETSRDANWRRLRDMPGLRFPRTQRISVTSTTPAAFGAAVAKLDVRAPVILRKAGTQTGRTVALINSDADLIEYAKTAEPGDYHVIDYIETKFRGAYFRKMRLFHIDGSYYPVVCHIDKVWNVHGANRRDVMAVDESLMAEEKQFLADWRSYVGATAADALDRVAAATQLEFFGVDFNVDDEGQLLIYELNAAMRHSFDHAENFPYKRPYDEATSAAFADMITRRITA